jgi:ssDNA-binding Zn-finger/Zn-ribbon topoisomerase 1
MNKDFEELQKHVGHTIICFGYGKDQDHPDYVCIECDDCHQQLITEQKGSETFEHLSKHIGHNNISCLAYGENRISVECWSCKTLLLNINRQSEVQNSENRASFVEDVTKLMWNAKGPYRAKGVPIVLNIHKLGKDLNNSGVLLSARVVTIEVADKLVTELLGTVLQSAITDRNVLNDLTTITLSFSEPLTQEKAHMVTDLLPDHCPNCGRSDDMAVMSEPDEKGHTYYCAACGMKWM